MTSHLSIDIVVLCLFVLRFNVPVNNLSVMSRRSQRLLGFNQYSRELCVLLKDTTWCRWWESYPGVNVSCSRIHGAASGNRTQELMCLAQGYNMVPPVGIVPRS